MFKLSKNSVVGPAKSIHRGTAQNAVCLYNDASVDEQGTRGAFADVANAIELAQEFIFIAGWTFHPNFHLQRHKGSRSVGELLLKKAAANPAILITIMTWCHKKIPGAGVITDDAENNEGGKELRRIWKRLTQSNKNYPKNILWRASPYDKTNAWSHHQKFIVCDGPANESQKNSVRIIRAFIGGLDISLGRFDWPEHPFMPQPPTTTEFRDTFDDWYNNELKNDNQCVRQPWHDVYAQLIGPAAWDLLREFVARWCPDQYYLSPLGDNSNQGIAKLFDKYQELLSGTDSAGRKIVLPSEKQPQIRSGNKSLSKRLWKIQLLHSINKIGWGPPTQAALKLCAGKVHKKTLRSLEWGPKRNFFERSIQDAHLEMIEAAEEFIYIESQYFISSGEGWDNTAHGTTRDGVENTVAKALVERIRKAIRQRPKSKPFHVYIVLPMFPEGSPDHFMLYPIRYLQWCTIEYMIKELYSVCGNDWRKFLSFNFLANWENSDIPNTNRISSRKARILAARRYMIYVHSKMMLVDDRFAIIGSANLNERSLHGDRDSELSIAIWPDDRKLKQARSELERFRKNIWNEHLGKAWMADNGNLKPGSFECVEKFATATSRNFLNFTAGIRNPNDGHLLQWPIETDGQDVFEVTSKFIPDFPRDGKADHWTWISKLNLIAKSPLLSRISE